VVLDGMTFDSKRECNRYAQLQLMVKAGLISDLKRQVSFVLVPGVKIVSEKRASPPIRYIADFTYIENGNLVVEDAKGYLTPEYRMKRHMLKALLGIDIKEI
jgi:hypothetical protein